MTKRYGGPSPAEFAAMLLRKQGIDVNDQRLEDRTAATRSRAKADRAVAARRVSDLARAVKVARRECELAEMDWRRSPVAENLRAARAAQLARGVAEAELLEGCLGDRDLVDAVMDQVSR